MSTFDALLRRRTGEDSREIAIWDPGTDRGLFTFDRASAS
jgi:hypothetical protein